LDALNPFSPTPDWPVLFWYTLIPAAVAIAVQAIFRRLVPPEKLRGQHDVAGFLVAVVGVLYAVVLGFLVVTVWTGFDTAQQTSDVEAGYVGDGLGYAELLPEPPRRRIQQLLAGYAVTVRDREFAELARGQQDPQGRTYLVAALRALAQARPSAKATFGEALEAQSSRDGVLTTIRQIADTRRVRAIQARDRLPRVMYFALLAGALMVMVFVYLFGVENPILQYTMTGTVAALLGLYFGLIVALNAPYSGAVRVSPEAWNSLIENNHLEQLAKGVTP
jgi:hypothetical protein